MQFKTLLAFTLCAAVASATTPPKPFQCSEAEVNFLVDNLDIWKENSGEVTGEFKDDDDKILTKLNKAVNDTFKDPLTGDISTASSTKPAGWPAFRKYALNMVAEKECVEVILKKETWERGTLLARQNLFLAIKKFWGSVDLSALPDSMCRFFFDQDIKDNELYPLKEDSFKNFRMACFSNSSEAKNTIKAHWTPKMVAQIPAAEFAVHNAIDLASVEISDKSSVYSKLSKDQVSSLITNTDNCMKLTAEIASSNQQAEVVALFLSPCLSKMDWLSGSTALSSSDSKVISWLRALPENAFSFFPSLASGVAVHLTGKQLAKFDSASPNAEFRCSGLPIHEVAKSAASSLTKECIAGRVNNSSKLVEFGPLAAKLPADAFSGVFADEEIIGRVVHSKNTEFLTADHYKMLLALTPKAWSKLAIPATSATPAEFPWDRLPVVTGEALRNMGEAFRVAFLASYKAIRRLAEDALADFTATEVIFATSGSPAFVAKGALEMIAKVNHKVIHNLGRDVPSGSQHPCAGVKLADYKAHQSILDHAGFRCIRSLAGIDAALESEKPEEVAKLPAMVLASFEYDRLMKFKDVLPKNFFVGMTPSIFAVFASPANCAKFSKEVVGSLDPKVFTRMSLECFGVLNVDLTATQISTLTVELFARLTRELFAKLKIYTGLSVEQLGSLSTAVTDPAKHAAHALVKAIFAGFTAAQVGALNERTVALMPVDNWEALRTDMLKAMKPEVLVSVNAERMLKVPPETRYVLSATQAKMLGSKVPKEQHPRAAFPPEVLENMVDKEAAKVMGSAGTMVVASMTIVVVSVLVGLVLL